jgi:hypothetical protein
VQALPAGKSLNTFVAMRDDKKAAQVGRET